MLYNIYMQISDIVLYFQLAMWLTFWKQNHRSIESTRKHKFIPTWKLFLLNAGMNDHSYHAIWGFTIPTTPEKIHWVQVQEAGRDQSTCTRPWVGRICKGKDLWQWWWRWSMDQHNIVGISCWITKFCLWIVKMHISHPDSCHASWLFKLLNPS